MVLEAHLVLRVTELDLLKKKLFARKMVKMGKKYGFLNLLEIFVSNFL